METMTEIHIFIPKSRLDFFERQIEQYKSGLKEYAEAYWWSLPAGKEDLQIFLQKAIEDYAVSRDNPSKIGAGALGMP